MKEFLDRKEKGEKNYDNSNKHGYWKLDGTNLGVYWDKSGTSYVRFDYNSSFWALDCLQKSRKIYIVIFCRLKMRYFIDYLEKDSFNRGRILFFYWIFQVVFKIKMHSLLDDWKRLYVGVFRGLELCDLKNLHTNTEGWCKMILTL